MLEDELSKLILIVLQLNLVLLNEVYLVAEV